MANLNLADQYRAARLNPGPEILGLRQAPFEELRKKVDAKMAVDLTRLYFGLPVPGGTAWFRDAFAASDASFSMVDNEREGAVLAASLLRGALTDGKIYAGLAVLGAAASGQRQPPVDPEFPREAEVTIARVAKSSRERAVADASKMTLLVPSKMADPLAALTQTPDWVKAAALWELVSAESQELTKALAKQVASVLESLSGEVADLREETSMLWWHVGGWSRLLERPFAELDQSLAAVLVGVDLADLSQTLQGPVAAPELMWRSLSTGRVDPNAKASLKAAVDAFLKEKVADSLKLSEQLKVAAETCPVLTALLKASDVGDAWQTPFRNATGGLSPEWELTPLALAKQVYRERLLMKALD